VRVQGKLSENALALLNFGLSLDGRAAQAREVSWQNRDQLRFILREGKNTPDPPDVRTRRPEGDRP